VVPYFPLGDEAMRRIVELQLARIARRVRESYNASFEYAPEVVDSIASRCKEVETGARNVDNILTRTLLPELSAECLGRMAAGESVTRTRIGVGDQGRFTYELS
jgi:type VI secretion system protein VasG